MIVFSDDLLTAAITAMADTIEEHEIGLELADLGAKWVGLDKVRRALFGATPFKGYPASDSLLRHAAGTRARGRCEFCGNREHLRCLCLTEIEAPAKPWDQKNNPLWYEHIVPRLAYSSLGVRWDVIESAANIVRVHKSVNQWKGTATLTPDEIIGLWKVHDFGADTEHASAVLLAAALLTNAPKYRLPVLEHVGQVARPRALGAYLLDRGRHDLAAELTAVNRQYLEESHHWYDGQRKNTAKARRQIRAATKARDGEPDAAC